MVQQELRFSEHKRTVKDKILEIFKSGKWVTYADIRDRFDRTEKGINSLDRYKRFLTAEGYNIIKRRRSDNCWEYKLEVEK